MRQVHRIKNLVFVLIALLICTASPVVGDKKEAKYVQFNGEKLPAVPGPAKETKVREQLYVDGYVEIGSLWTIINLVDVKAASSQAEVDDLLGRVAAENGGELYSVDKQSYESAFYSERPGRTFAGINPRTGVLDPSYNVTSHASKAKEHESYQYNVTVWRRDPERAKRKLLDFRGKRNLWEAVGQQDLARVNAALAQGTIPTRFESLHPEPKEKREEMMGFLGKAAESGSGPILLALVRSLKSRKNWAVAFQSDYDEYMTFSSIVEADDAEVLRTMVDNGYSIEKFLTDNKTQKDDTNWRVAVLHSASARGARIVNYLVSRDAHLSNILLGELSTHLYPGLDCYIYSPIRR